MYAHWCDLIGTLTISPARFFNVLCLCFLFARFHFSTSLSCSFSPPAMQTTNNSTAANGGCVLSICYHRKFFTKLLSFCQCMPYSPGDGYGLAQSFFLSKAVPTNISMVCVTHTHPQFRKYTFINGAGIHDTRMYDQNESTKQQQ